MARHSRTALHPNSQRMPPPAAPATSHDGPPPPGEIDFAVVLSGGTSIAIEATPQCMQQAKTMPIPTLTEKVAQLTRENGRLRAELAHAHEKCAACSRLAARVTHIATHLQQSLLRLQGLSTASNGGAYKPGEKSD